jgi:ABC-type bacteriocin/lantibiotic exporter with double-glycine peptidase domain
LVRLNSLEASVLKIQELRNKMQDTLRPLSIYDRRGKNTCLKTTFEALEFVDVYFGYPEAAEPTLRDFNFKIRRSEVIGIKGYSGAGKTTFLNLMSGLLEVDAGQILLNGTPINGTDNLLGTVGYLPQDVSVISGTILENITFRSSCTKQDIEEIRKLGEISKLNDFVSLMPKGLMTELNQGALTISGGQRQKIAITRLLFHGRALLILDEATNAIDVEDEDKIIAQIKAQNNFGAMIIVTHRLSTLKHCDRVYNFKKGKLLETKKRF